MIVVQSLLSSMLDFRKGDLAIQRYNEVRDAIGDLASFAFMNVYMRLIIVKI